MRIRFVHKKTTRTGAKEFTGYRHLNLDAKGAKQFTEVKDKDGNVTDFRDVKLKGYLSTWQHVTPSDRDGEYVVRGAFTETIPKFMKNPVLLAGHYNSPDHAVGVFTKVVEDDQGLYVEAELSNAPGVADYRFKVAEGVIRTLSMGGRFHRSDDGRGIVKVDLYEGSLVAIPANPDAVFTTRQQADVESMEVAT